jgi:hypothetical protein
VDISRFTQDEEYKRETILGLTMYVRCVSFFSVEIVEEFILFFCCRSVDDEIFETAISLAERYDISKWEMFMSHLEWLFTDSE